MSEVVNKFTTFSALSIRPAALNRGAIKKAKSVISKFFFYH